MQKIINKLPSNPLTAWKASIILRLLSLDGQTIILKFLLSSRILKHVLYSTDQQVDLVIPKRSLTDLK